MRARRWKCIWLLLVDLCNEPIFVSNAKLHLLSWRLRIVICVSWKFDKRRLFKNMRNPNTRCRESFTTIKSKPKGSKNKSKSEEMQTKIVHVKLNWELNDAQSHALFPDSIGTNRCRTDTSVDHVNWRRNCLEERQTMRRWRRSYRAREEVEEERKRKDWGAGMRSWSKKWMAPRKKPHRWKGTSIIWWVGSNNTTTVYKEW